MKESITTQLLNIDSHTCNLSQLKIAKLLNSPAETKSALLSALFARPKISILKVYDEDQLFLK